MKRFLSVIALVLGIVLIIGFFLPAQKTISHTVNTSTPFDGVSRVIVNKQLWKNWWPGAVLDDSTLTYKKMKITLGTIFLNGFNATASDMSGKVDLALQSSATYNAETALTLNTTIHYSANPLTKVWQYLNMGAAKSNYEELLHQIKNAFSDIKKVYGFDIQMSKVPNSSYVSVKQDFDHYPNNEEIYEIIDGMKAYIVSENCKVMNEPILNIIKENHQSYTAMVALATDRDLPTKGKFMLKQMMLGNIVVAQVTGGPAAIEKCRQAVQFYVNDFRKVSPAIAFERMISNRLTEDSSRWVTTINYPVFQ